MGRHELEHFRLLFQKLTKELILLVSIGMEIASECVHVPLMVKAYLLSIKGDGVKVFREVLEGTGIVERCS